MQGMPDGRMDIGHWGSLTNRQSMRGSQDKLAATLFYS